MKTKIFTAPTSNLAADLLIEELSRNNSAESSHVFIAPDRFTLSYEYEILEKLNLPGAFNIEVMSFRRLARKYLARNAANVLSPEAGVMLLKKVIEEVKPDLTVLKFLASRPEFASDMYAVVTDLRNNGADGGKISVIKSQKAQDIALIYNAYLKEIAGAYSDSTTIMHALVREIKNIPEIRAANFYFADFYDFSAVQENVVKELIEFGLSANFAATEKKRGANARLYPNALPEKISAIAKLAGADAEIIPAKTQTEQKKQPLVNGLFGYSNHETTQNFGFLEAYAAKNPREEAFFIAQNIAKSVECGARYKDFAVVSANFAEYLPYFSEAFDFFGIPYFAEQKRPLAWCAEVRFLLAALNVAKKNFRRREVAAFMCEARAGFDPAEVSIFLDYCAKYNIEHGRFLKPFAIEDERFPPELLENLRKRLADLILPLAEKTLTVAERTEILKGLTYPPPLSWPSPFAKGGFEGSLSKFPLKLRGGTASAGGDMSDILPPEVLDAERQTPERLAGVFSDMVKILGQTVFSAEEYYNIFASAVTFIELSFVPQRIDTVFLGDAEGSRYSGVKTMFAAGLSAGAMPSEKAGGGLLSPSDAEAWGKEGVILNPSAREKITQERFIVKEILSKPEEKLIITRPLAGPDAKPRAPGQVFQMLCELYNISPALTYPHVSRETYVLCAKKNSPLGRGGCEADGVVKLRLKNLSASSLSAEDGKKFISPSKLENYMKCPFRHYAQYGLKLKEKETAEESAAEFGDIIHAVLELFFAEKHYLNPADVSKKLLQRVLQKEKFKHAKTHLLTETLAEELKFMLPELAAHVNNSNFKPAFTETSAGSKLNAGGEVIFMRGKVDRIDVLKNYAVIIDYKTASKVDFGLKEVLFGERLQLFLYAGALQEEKGITAAGLFYLPLPHGFSGDKNGCYYKYSGFMSGEGGMTEEFSEEIFKKGKILPKEDFQKVAAYAQKAAEKAASEILEGRADVAPAEGACAYCAFGDFCGVQNFPEAERKFTGKVSIENFNAREK